MLVKFPERNYIIDAKMSLTHWTKYINEKDENQKKQYLKDHIASVRNHLFGSKGLAKKNYNKLYGIKSLQSVIVFFPASSLYSVTLDADKTLQTEALKANLPSIFGVSKPLILEFFSIIKPFIILFSSFAHIRNKLAIGLFDIQFFDPDS